MMFHAYMITNTVTGQSYIGITVGTVQARWKKHLRNARYGSDAYLHRAIRKYGASAFLVEHIASATNRDDLIETEKELIRDRQSHWRDGGYNLTPGGEGVTEPLPTDRKPGPRKGFKWPADHGEKVRSKLKGRPRPPEVTAKIAAANRARAKAYWDAKTAGKPVVWK